MIVDRLRRFSANIWDADGQIQILYSGLYFAIGFIILSYTSHAWSTANAWDVGHQPRFSYDGMDSLRETTGWTVAKIGWVYLAPPLWGLIVSILSLGGFHAIDPRQTHLRTFLFWLSLSGFLLYYSYIITGIFSGEEYSSVYFTGFIGFYCWLEWETGTLFGILGIQAVLSLLYALLYSKPALQLNHSRFLISRADGKNIIMLRVVIMPFLLGTVLIAISTFPMDLGYQAIRLVCYLPVIVVIFIGFGFFKSKHINIVKGGLQARSLLLCAVGMIVLFLLSRLILSRNMYPLW